MAGDGVNIISVFPTAFKQNRQGAVIALLAFGNVFFTGMWRDAERRANDCYDDKVMQERRHGEERDKVNEKLNTMSYTIGELKATVKMQKK